MFKWFLFFFFFRLTILKWNARGTHIHVQLYTYYKYIYNINWNISTEGRRLARLTLEIDLFAYNSLGIIINTGGDIRTCTDGDHSGGCWTSGSQPANDVLIELSKKNQRRRKKTLTINHGASGKLPVGFGSKLRSPGSEEIITPKLFFVIPLADVWGLNSCTYSRGWSI